MNGIVLKDVIVFASIMVFFLLLGFILKKILIRWIGKISAQTKWKGDDILVNSFKNFVLILFLLVGLFIATLNFPEANFFNKLLVFQFLKVAFVIVLTIVVSKVLTGWVSIYQQSADAATHKSSILQYLVKVVVFVIGGLIILQSLGISITPILTALGVGGLAVALALQDTLSNLFAGLQILAAKNTQPGDFIKLENGDEGYITDINWRSTTIRALSNRIIIIPNQKLASSIINNYSKPDNEIVVIIELGVSYASDLEKVDKITTDVARTIMQTVNGGVVGFEPFVRYNKFESYSVNFSVIMRVKEFTDQFLIKHEFIKLLHQRYRSEGIEISLPIATVFLGENKKI